MLASRQPPSVLHLLANQVRWELLQALAESDCRVQELTQLLEKPQNLVSYHLRKLREAELVNERRSSADSRDVYYHLELGQLQEEYRSLGQALHPVFGSDVTALSFDAPDVRPLRVLFLCTHNSARSQLAEGILRARSWLPVEVWSAGSEPTSIHPLAVRAAKELGVDISQQRSRHLDELADGAFDLVITVCDRMREACPAFPNGPRQAHWSIADPACVQGPEANRYEAFRETALELAARIHYLLLTLDRQKETQHG